MQQDMRDTAIFEMAYDLAIFGAASVQVYGGSGYYNLGYWDENLPALPGNMPTAAANLARRHLLSEDHAATHQVTSVLDVACGLGATTALFSQHYPNAKITGINISKRQLEAASARCPQAHFIQMDATKLAFADASMDRIHCVEAAFYFDTRLDFLKEARRVLRPHGRIILTDIIYRSTLGLQIPASAARIDPQSYLADVRAAGLRVQRFEDITRRTADPFVEVLDQLGHSLWSRLIKRAIAGYYLVELEPDPYVNSSGQ